MLYFPYFLIDITQKGEKYCATKRDSLVCRRLCRLASPAWRACEHLKERNTVVSNTFKLNQ